MILLRLYKSKTAIFILKFGYTLQLIQYNIILRAFIKFIGWYIYGSKRIANHFVLWIP